jgi:hypothetical protein
LIFFLFKVGDEHVGVSVLEDHVIHIGFDVLVELEGPIRQSERGSEWEPIKILLERD